MQKLLKKLTYLIFAMIRSAGPRKCSRGTYSVSIVLFTASYALFTEITRCYLGRHCVELCRNQAKVQIVVFSVFLGNTMMLDYSSNTLY